MPPKPRPTRTIGPLHFEDLAPPRFEDLVRQLLYNFREWLYLDATGVSGSDGGTDIRGVEAFLGNASLHYDEPLPESESRDTLSIEREWRIQCKRYRRVTPRQASLIAKELIPDPADVPYGVILAAPADLSARAISSFRSESLTRGATEAHVWSRAHLEDMLFLPDNDRLLFAYFGIALKSGSRASLVALRRRLTIKSRIIRAVGAESPDEIRDKRINLLIRDAQDDGYPDAQVVEGVIRQEVRPWHLVLPAELHPRALLVCTGRMVGWLKPDGTWDIAEQTAEVPGELAEELSFRDREDDTWTRRQEAVVQVPDNEFVEVERVRGISYDDILEADKVGDSHFPCPHLYCRFTADNGPYLDAIIFLALRPLLDGGTTLLEPDVRRQLFKPLATS